ncbi:ubiquitin carboxyl-terminal hydrolase Usp2 isoform X1 [Teleopsis dalmanni]|uniref:ubiquitin carboxyl-terminal hydrolase Usp2 isoform X1 n=1 Tax=Teleopsis dalmanni TaxID=139649 RepID=UPI0018CCFC04|nr:ubiquitin carboxyl-terminal hydrolase Usp2 isoform X1 [Teleopsis dalmanni]XP_037938706.1 ubiquitin carboxyl-terminal hydrolase Usp2 isoform X1 [Teleopsis dalmanni]XP_037938707.1 ubiquitin carboxyl-terminal hydrolase Usp2 isoform X1 [Teleopsis dalmanni]XP_037938708.1 ubiquitin carboxyl-terminal hydrolase Usp2 isoform X1 [Teleopsis dalmanni]
MIDVNKGRNNFQKLPILKSKCDYYTSSLKTSSSNKNPIIGSKLNRLSAEEEKKLNRNIIDNFRTPTNPVREANQQFFLVSEYKDKNFLKEECKIAHAQVYKPQLKSRNQSQNTSGRVGSGPDNKNNNIITTQLKSCNNINCRSVSLTKSTSPSEEIKKRIKTIANTATDSSSALNGMRRSVNVEQIGTTATAVNVHKVDLEFKVKALPTSAKTTAGVGNSVTCTSTGLGSSKTSNRQIKPLVHRTIPTTTITAVAAAARLAAAQNNVSFTNRVNNNSSGSSTINGSNTNNNMQTSYKLSSDHDDIKYIDSDEPTTVVQERKREICDQNCCTQKSANPHAGADASKTRIRPKSTIICSATNHVFEKVNNYKYANGSVVNAQRNCSSICKGSAIGSTDCISDIRRSGIDSHSIKASIDKFNSLNDQKRLPFNSVQLRSHGGSGSTSNLQHRHSSDFDNCNLQLGSNSGGGSLTRANYRTSTNVATPAVTATNGKLNTSTHPTPSIALYSTTRALLNTSTNSGSNTSSLPSKSKNHELLNRSSPLSPYSRDAKDNSSSASSSASSRQENTNGTSLHETKKLNSISSLIESDDSIRSSSIRSALPPSSPSASRYLDRETGRTSAYTSIHSNNDDAISGKISGEEKSEGLCGLKNIGNTCFMNSVIQCLSHTSELTKFLRSHNAVRSSPSKDQQILHEFARLIRDMWSNGTRSVTPMELKRAFSAKHRMYSDYNQQDAQEFLRFFLDSLHCALNSGMKAGSLKIDENLTDNKKADLTWEWYTRQENSLIRDLFVGQLKSTLKCTICNNASVTFDPFWDLSVPLPSSSRCKLDACLDLFIREEVLDGDEMPTCSKCKTRRKCTKSFTIQRFPKYLVIHLKRFSETRWSKLSNIVEFPTSERELNMGPYASNKSNSINYSLYAISNHMGSTAGGHYVALCKHPVTKKWHEFNDNVVSDALPESHLTSSSAYILFYERV